MPVPTEIQTDLTDRIFFDIPYASLSPAQKLDIYLPPRGEGPFPIILAIHGGAFAFGDKRDFQLAPMLAGLKHGYAVVSINYRKSMEAHFPAQIHDVKAAIRWLRAHAGEYFLAAGSMAVWGGSAGGYLALMAGVSAGESALRDPALGNPDLPEDVQAVVAWFPPVNFLTMDGQLAESGFSIPEKLSHATPDSPESLLLGQPIGLVPDLVQAANPESYLHTGLPPFFIQHGSHDRAVPYQQSVHFVEMLKALRNPPTLFFEILTNARHADPVFETPENIQKVLDFLKACL